MVFMVSAVYIINERVCAKVMDWGCWGKIKRLGEREEVSGESFATPDGVEIWEPTALKFC